MSQTASSESPRGLRLDSRLTLGVLLVALIIYLVILPTAVTEERRYWVTLVYVLLGIGLAYAVWATTYIYDLNEDHLVLRRAFGLLKPTVLRHDQIRLFRTRPNSMGEITRLEIKYNSGSVQFHAFQKNFTVAVESLQELNPDAPLEKLSEWAL